MPVTRRTTSGTFGTCRPPHPPRLATERPPRRGIPTFAHTHPLPCFVCTDSKSSGRRQLQAASRARSEFQGSVVLPIVAASLETNQPTLPTPGGSGGSGASGCGRLPHPHHLGYAGKQNRRRREVVARECKGLTGSTKKGPPGRSLARLRTNHAPERPVAAGQIVDSDSATTRNRSYELRIPTVVPSWVTTRWCIR